jgi:hypothetical protein
LLPCPEPAAGEPHWFDASLGRVRSMRWKIDHHGHDPRQIDLVAIFALLILIVAAWRFYNEPPSVPSQTAFIVPSQSVRW